MNNNTNTAFVQSANNELKSLDSRLQQIDEQINELNATREGLQQQRGALRQFLTVAGALPDEEPSGIPSVMEGVTRDVTDDTSWVRHRLDPKLADLIYSILDKLNGRQLHYKEIVDKVAESGWPFTENERSREAWVNRVLNGDSRFVRPFRRGHYALRKHYPDTIRSVGERMKRRRR